MTGVRVLLVDDQQPFLLAATEVLAVTPGFRLVGTAASGEEAVGAAARLRPDLVLMDVHLPGIDGMAATRQIIARWPSTVVLLLSTYPASDVGPDVRECGAAGYIAKSGFGPGCLAEAWADLPA